MRCLGGLRGRHTAQGCAAIDKAATRVRSRGGRARARAPWQRVRRADVPREAVGSISHPAWQPSSRWLCMCACSQLGGARRCRRWMRASGLQMRPRYGARHSLPGIPSCIACGDCVPGAPWLAPSLRCSGVWPHHRRGAGRHPPRLYASLRRAWAVRPSTSVPCPALPGTTL